MVPFILPSTTLTRLSSIPYARKLNKIIQRQSKTASDIISRNKIVDLLTLLTYGNLWNSEMIQNTILSSLNGLWQRGKSESVESIWHWYYKLPMIRKALVSDKWFVISCLKTTTSNFHRVHIVWCQCCPFDFLHLFLRIFMETRRYKLNNIVWVSVNVSFASQIFFAVLMAKHKQQLTKKISLVLVLQSIFKIDP